MNFRVLITDRFDVTARARLQTAPGLDVATSASPRPSAAELEGRHALIIRSRTAIDSSLLEQAPDLKVIVTATSGFDHIDLTACEKRGVRVMFTPEANAASACELTWALILACLRRLPEAGRAIKAGEWKREALIGRQAQGKTLGIVGLGRIGSRVARVAHAFGMRTIAFDPYKEADDFARLSTESVAFDELLKLADVVTFHVPATAETQNMLRAPTLEAMNRQAILINASRGSIVAERDLVLALNEGWIAGLGLDVFEREPLPRDSKLLTHPRVVLTPHLGATTDDAFAAASLEAAQKIIAFARDGAVSDPLPPPEEWFQAGFSGRGGEI